MIKSKLKQTSTTEPKQNQNCVFTGRNAMGVLQVGFTNLCCTTMQVVLEVPFIMVTFRQ